MADEKKTLPPPKDEAGGAAVAEKPREKTAPPKADKLPPYRVVLHNDDVNDMLWVTLTIEQLTPLKEFEAIQRMFEAHRRGKATLLTTHQERAELYRDQFASRGLTVTIHRDG